MTYEALPWLVFPPAVDLANTVRVTPRGERDLLETEDQLVAWIGAERGRIGGVEAVSGRLAEVRALRESVRELLYAGARGNRPPAAARRRINEISAAAPVHLTLTDTGSAVEMQEARDPFALFEATIARSAIELADSERQDLAVCGAPSCGMLFLREHPRQVWCSKPCGNRARVARHAARHSRTRGASA